MKILQPKLEARRQTPNSRLALAVGQRQFSGRRWRFRANKVVLPSRVIWEGMAKKMPDRYPVDDGFPPLILALLEPMGRISSEASVGGVSYDQDATGFSDPMVEAGINLIGPKALRSIPDLLRYEPKLSIDVIVDLAFPIGEYDSDEPLNLGQNRWYGRVARPSSGNSARGCPAGAPPWRRFPRSGSSAITPITWAKR